MKLVTIAVAILSAFGADTATFDQRSAEVRSLIERHDYERALEKAKALNREQLDNIAVYRWMAEAQLGMGDYAGAETSTQWMLDLKIGKTDWEGWRVIAQLREVSGDIDGAMQALNLAYERAPADQAKSLRAYSAHLLWLAGKFAFAEAAAKESGALEVLARVRMSQGRAPEAVEILRSLKPHARNLYLLAQASKSDADAAAFLKAAWAIQASPDNANRELVLYLVSRPDGRAEAIEIARRESLRLKDVYTQDALAMALMANGKASEARTTMEAILKVGTRHPDILAHATAMGIKPE